MTQAEVARHHVLRSRGLRIDASALSRLERGRRRSVPRQLVDALLDCYEADQATRREILALIDADTSPVGRPRPALWRKHAALLSAMQFEGFLELEPRASALYNYEPFIIPGLVQTAHYARVVIERIRPDLKAAEVRALVEVRVDRQKKIAHGALCDFRALIEEDALRRPLGDDAVMREQLERLIAESERPEYAVRILPAGIGYHPGLAGPFVLMSFPEATRNVVWVETMSSSVYFDGEADAERYTEVFADLWERALEPGDTRARLKAMIKELQ